MLNVKSVIENLEALKQMIDLYMKKMYTDREAAKQWIDDAIAALKTSAEADGVK